MIKSRDIGHLVKEIREQRKMSVETLAKKSGKPVSTISRIERNGIHGINVLGEIFESLDVDVEIYVKPKEKK